MQHLFQTAKNSLLIRFCAGAIWVGTISIIPACSESATSTAQSSSAQSSSAQQEGEKSQETDSTVTIDEHLENIPLPEVEAGMRASIRGWVECEDFPIDVALFDTVFWDPRDTISLRELLRRGPLVKDKSVMEIGTGSGLISLCSLKAGASKVVATDVNPSAIACARYNAERLKLKDRFQVRRVPLNDSGAFTVIKDDEKFDFIISNPPWEDDKPKSIDEYALYDPGFVLLDSLLKDAKQHLNKDGQILLAYGCVTAIEMIFKLGDKYDYDYRVLDTRELDNLPEVFLPGMLIRLTPKKEVAATSSDEASAPANENNSEKTENEPEDENDPGDAEKSTVKQ